MLASYSSTASGSIRPLPNASRHGQQTARMQAVYAAGTADTAGVPVWRGEYRVYRARRGEGAARPQGRR